VLLLSQTFLHLLLAGFLSLRAPQDFIGDFLGDFLADFLADFLGDFLTVFLAVFLGAFLADFLGEFLIVNIYSKQQYFLKKNIFFISLFIELSVF
jgi:hypothetical protein